MKVHLLKGLGPFLALVVMSVILSLVSPHFLTFDNITNVFRQSAINALLALGHLSLS